MQPAAIVSLALPLFLVTLVSQNLPGLVVLRTAGYRPPPRPLLVGVGLASLLAAPFGAHGVNLAAITAAICTNPEAHTGVIIIADDYDSELRFAGRPVAILSSLDQGGTVLAIGGFSKVTFPGLRLGYIVGAPSLIARLIQARARDGTPVATAAQPALAELIAGGGLARHLRALRQRMGARRLALAAALEARLGDMLTVSPQEVGMHLAAVLNAPLRGWESDVTFAAFAATRGLDLDPLSTHSGVAEGRQGFLLGYAAWDEQGLTAGVEILAALLAEER